LQQSTVAATRGSAAIRARGPRAAQPARNTAARRLEGRIRVNFRGGCVVDTAEGPVALDARALAQALPGAPQGALHGDEVLVELRGTNARTGLRGSLVKVLSRAPLRLTGVLDPERGFVADDARFPRALSCREPASHRSSSSLYGAELCPELDGHGAEVRLVCRFGSRAVAADEREAMLWREQVEPDFPVDALEEAQARSRKPHVPSATHEDLRHLGFVTIDPVDAEDHDDAVFAERRRDGSIRCCVAIADVASLLPQGGPLDEEARARGATLYLPGHLIPMLPRCISTDAASLLPGQDRRAVVLDLVLEPTGEVRSRYLTLGVIRSRERLSYDEAADLLYDAATAHPDVQPFAPLVTLLDDVAHTLRDRRARQGALQVDSQSVRIDVDADGEPLRLRVVGSDAWRKRACSLVEELMLLANESVAEMLEDAGMDAFCRAHTAPSAGRTAGLLRTAARHGVELSAAQLADPRALRERVRTLPSAAARSALGTALLDAMPTASYEAGREAHFALATRSYVHFTSPIRRYPDVLVHRAVHTLVLGRDRDAAPLDLPELNEKQQRARRIHFEINALYGALTAPRFLGRRMLGTVTRVSAREVTVMTDEPAISLRCKLVGDIAHGDRVEVVPTAVDIATRTVRGRIV
jgi:ribonuclease R